MPYKGSSRYYSSQSREMAHTMEKYLQKGISMDDAERKTWETNSKPANMKKAKAGARRRFGK